MFQIKTVAVEHAESKIKVGITGGYLTLYLGENRAAEFCPSAETSWQADIEILIDLLSTLKADMENHPTGLIHEAENVEPETYGLEESQQESEKNTILVALEKEKWNQTNTAKRLGITFRSLRYRIKKYDLKSTSNSEHGDSQ